MHVKARVGHMVAAKPLFGPGTEWLGILVTGRFLGG